MVVSHYKVLDVRITAHPHPQEGIQVIILGRPMEGGTADLGIVTHNLIGIQVQYKPFLKGYV